MASVNDNNAAANEDQSATHSPELATRDNPRSSLLIATEELHEPTRSNEGHESQNVQLACIPMVASFKDNFQELDMREMDASIVKSPLQASTSLIMSSEPVAEMPQAVDEQHDEDPTGAPVIQSVAPGVSAEHVMSSNHELEKTSSLDSSSSTEYLEIAAPRKKRYTRRKVSLTERLEPFENTPSMPKKRGDLKIFSYPYRTIWNKTIQDVQSQLTERFKRQQLEEEAPTLRETLSAQRIDSGRQQTAMNVAENSDLEAIVEADAKATNKQDSMRTSDLNLTVLQPNVSEDQLEPIDGKLVEVTDHLEPCTEAMVTGGSNDVVPVVTTPESPKKEKLIRRNSDQEMVTVSHENGPNPELDTISAENKDPQENAPLDAMIVPILIAAQGELCNRKQIEDWISIQRLKDVLRINTRLGVSKLFKNLLLLKQADLLAVRLNTEHHITDVCLKLPQVVDERE